MTRIKLAFDECDDMEVAKNVVTLLTSQSTRPTLLNQINMLTLGGFITIQPYTN